MAAIPRLWVYKCNASSPAGGDWDAFFLGPQPGNWGGSESMSNPLSRIYLWDELAVDHLVLCWQSDRERAVGLCRVARLDDWVDQLGEAQRDILLELIGEPFSPPVPLLKMKKSDAALARVHAFTQGLAGTLYATSSDEASLLLERCGVPLSAVRKLIQSASAQAGGAGFGTPEENKKVEDAAVKALRRKYRLWRLKDLQETNCGYDFEAILDGEVRHIELKGVRGASPAFIITENEARAAQNDADWCLAVVTEALSPKPKLHEWSSEKFLTEFELRPISHLARLRSR
jgi:hypothetical protein